MRWRSQTRSRITRSAPAIPGFFWACTSCGRKSKPRHSGHGLSRGTVLGAGISRACVLTGIMVLDGNAPHKARLASANRNPASQSWRRSLNVAVPAASYRNGDAEHHDLVTDVPATFPPEEYVHPCPLTMVTAIPGPEITQTYGVFSWHHAGLYAEALGDA